jgi:hypothetical protein
VTLLLAAIAAKPLFNVPNQALYVYNQRFGKALRGSIEH